MPKEELKSFENYLEYYSLYTIEELHERKAAILSSKNIDNFTLNIINTIITERLLVEDFPPATILFISKYYPYLADVLSKSEIKTSVNFFLENDIDYPNLIQWCPMLLSIEKVQIIYRQLKRKEFTNEQIALIIGKQFNQAHQLYSNIKTKPELVDRINDPEFVDFVKFLYTYFSENKRSTESFQKSVTMLMKQNQNLLSRLK